VPLYEFAGHRKQLTEWAVKKGPDGMEEYKAKKNATSIDGLPGLTSPSSLPRRLE